MGKIVVSQFVTVDGVAEDPGGAENAAHGGWAFRYERGPVGDQFKLDELMAADALLLGRKTYEGFAAAWPEREGEFADKFNGMAKYVVSSTLTDPSWTNSTVVGLDEIAGLRDRHEGDILVNGSMHLLSALIERDLVDELRLMVFPEVAGGGKRLFREGGTPHRLELVEAKPAGETLIVVYRPKA